MAYNSLRVVEILLLFKNREEKIARKAQNYWSSLVYGPVSKTELGQASPRRGSFGRVSGVVSATTKPPKIAFAADHFSAWGEVEDDTVSKWQPRPEGLEPLGNQVG
jgi:hypothetical protein